MTGDRTIVPAEEALRRLQAGNRRFVSGAVADNVRSRKSGHAGMIENQSPFAIVLGCSDSRVPAEIIFDQGLGDLFVIRVAGNIVAPSQIGSIEFAAARFATQLVVVLGHSQCGAILATLEELRQPMENQSKNLRSIVDRIRPSFEALLDSAPDDDTDVLLRRAVRSNVERSVLQLRHGSDILEQLIADQGLLIVGAEYSLETGEVSFHNQ